MISASCRRLLHRNGVMGVYYPHHREQRAATVAKLLQIMNGRHAKRLFCTSASLNKLNQPKLKEEVVELASDLTHPHPHPPGVSPPDHASAKEDSKLRSQQHTAAVNTNAVDGVLQGYEEEGQAWIEEGSKEEVGGKREEQRQKEEEWIRTELTWRKLPSIYLKLSKSRLTGMYLCEWIWDSIARVLVYSRCTRTCVYSTAFIPSSKAGCWQ